MDRTAQLDHAYGLLVALDEDRGQPVAPDLMDAFNLLAERHQPQMLVLPAEQDYDRRLGRAHQVLLELAESAENIREALDLYASADLIGSLIRGRQQ